MRGISMLEPRATLVAIGVRRFDTRTWAPQYRGILAIQASREYTSAQRRLASSPAVGSALMRADMLPSNCLMPTLAM